MKNGRFSGKNCSLVETFWMIWSASTWPKSGFTATERFRLLVSALFTSRPTSTDGSSRFGVGRVGSEYLGRELSRVARYGVSSRSRFGCSPKSSTSGPKRETTSSPDFCGFALRGT